MSKVYMPTDLINSNYSYEMNADDYFVVHTNHNCYNNGYNTIYCDCYKVYPTQDYLVTNSFSCYNGNYASIPYNNLTDDIWYRIDLDKILLIFLILAIVTIAIPYKIIGRWFGRWLKV